MTTDEQIGAMCAWLKKNKMVGQTTLAGRLTLTPKDEAYTAMVFGAAADEQQRLSYSSRAKPSL